MVSSTTRMSALRLFNGRKFWFLLFFAIFSLTYLNFSYHFRTAPHQHQHHNDENDQQSLSSLICQQPSDTTSTNTNTNTLSPTITHIHHHHPLSPSTSQQQQQQLPFRIEIKLLTYNRLESLKRCVQSFQNALYDQGQYNVDLHIFIDHFHTTAQQQPLTKKQKPPRPLTPQQQLDKLKQQLQIQQQIIRYVRSIDWPHGHLTVHKRQQNAHLQNQWLESWYPLGNNDTYAYVAEDDTVVSPYWYQYLKKLLMHYRYAPIYLSMDNNNSTNHSTHTTIKSYKRLHTPNMYGISLQKQHLVPALRTHKSTSHALTRLQTNQQPFMYPLIGSWGQLFFPEAWIDFRQYYDEHRYLSTVDEQHKPHIGGMVTDQWYRSMGETIWTPWIIRWAYARTMYNMYANFQRTLAGNYREAGVNYDGKGARLDFALVTPRSDPSFQTAILDGQKLPGFDSVQRYDYCMRRVVLGRLIDTSIPTSSSSSSSDSDSGNSSNEVIRAIVTSSSDPIYLYNQMCLCEQMSDKVLAQVCRSQFIYHAGGDRGLAQLIRARGFHALYTPSTMIKDNVSTVLLDDVVHSIWGTTTGNRSKSNSSSSSSSGTSGTSGTSGNGVVKSIAIIDLTGRLLVPPSPSSPSSSMDTYVSGAGLGVSSDNRVVIVDPSEDGDARIRELLRQLLLPRRGGDTTNVSSSSSSFNFGTLVSEVKKIYPKAIPGLEGNNWREVTENNADTFLIKKLDYGCKAVKCI